MRNLIIKIRGLSLLRIFCYVAISVFIVLNSSTLSDGSADLLQDSFILSFLGIFAGLAIACITIIFSNIEKIRDSVHRCSLTDRITDLNENIDKLFIEIRQDTNAIVLILVISFITILVREVNFPYVNFNIEYLTKQQIISIIEVTLIFLTLRVVIDIMQSLFGLNEILSLIQKGSSKIESTSSKR